MHFSNFRFGLLISVALILFSSCEKKSTPKSSLEEYVSYRFKAGQSKDEILSKVTGEMGAEIKAMSDEEFKSFIDLSSYKKVSFKVVNEKCQETQCFITYVLKYETLGNNEKQFTTEVKKIAELVLEEGAWKINNVDNVKTYHDSHLPIEAAPAN